MCKCQACRDLLEECGADLFPLYRKKLLVRGWAGSVSPVEKAYRLAHMPGAAEAGERLKAMRER